MPARPHLFLSISRAYRPTPTREGALFVASDMAGLPQTYRLGGPDRFPVRVAPSQDRTLPVAHTPLGLLLRIDSGGDEVWQLALAGEAGDLRQITSDRLAIHRDVTVAPDGRRAGLVFNPGGRADWAVGVIDLETGGIDVRIDRGGYWHWLGWSEDGELAAVTEQHGSLVNDAYLLHPDGALQPLLPEARRVEQAFWAGGRLFAVTDLGGDFLGLAEVEAAEPTRIVRWLVHEDHDVELALPDPTGRRALVAVNLGPYDRLRLLDLEGGGGLDGLGVPPGLLYADNACPETEQAAWSSDGERLWVAWESSSRPAEIREIFSDVVWTQASGEPPAGLTEPVEVSIPSFDGLRVPALHYRVDGTPRPTVVWFHGGPESQARANYSPVIAMWNAAGFDVLTPNVRGSTGYGVHYASLDDRERRWDAVRDGCRVGRWLRESGFATHLVAMGASYGGFMTLAVLVEEPGLWDAGVDIVGIADWHTFFRNTSGWRRSQRAVEYGDPEGPDGAFLAEFSPLRRAGDIRAHLLVIHGRNDPRVPVSEAEQISRVVPGSELMIFDDEGHGIARHGNRARAYGRALDFVRERLGLD
jgi:dienelactone hydrolase